jgi:hypothetical protein
VETKLEINEEDLPERIEYFFHQYKTTKKLKDRDDAAFHERQPW